MIPVTLSSTVSGYEIKPSKTFCIDFQNNRITTLLYDRDSLIQTLNEILSTDRYAYEIYTGKYGTEITKLLGQPYPYIEAEFPRLITDALLQDDRITDVSNITMEKVDSDSCLVTLEVSTIFGDVELERRLQF